MTNVSATNAWTECLKHVKFWRNEVRRSFGESLNRLEIVVVSENCVKIYGLANICRDSLTSQQTIVATKIPKVYDQFLLKYKNDNSLIIEFKPIFNLSNISQLTEKISAELSLLYERLRSQIVTGITAYSLHPQHESFLVATPSQLHLYKNEKFMQLASYVKSAVLNPTFSPVDTEFVAFTCKGELYIDRKNEMVFASKSQENQSNGVASFIAQEEFERFEGFWWSPTRIELLYEQVDESTVPELIFATPGQHNSNDVKMRYPLAGSTNPISTLRICHVNVDCNNMVLDIGMQLDIKKIVPWYEYLVRCGWTPDGEHIYMYVMNRKQNHAALLLVSRVVFCNVTMLEPERFVKILYEENSDKWINYTNLIEFLPNEGNNNIRAIIASEINNFCHLFLHIFNISYEDIDNEEYSFSTNSSHKNHMPVLQENKTFAESIEPQLSVADPLIAVNPPAFDVVRSDETINEIYDNPESPGLENVKMFRERQVSNTSRRLSHQVGILIDHRVLPITDVNSNWAVIKESMMKIDYNRQHVYYLCNKVSPTIYSLAISSFGILSKECHILTPENLCCKFERAQPELNINPDVGFVCWVSNMQSLPECRFYYLIHHSSTQNSSSSLNSEYDFNHKIEFPSAVFAFKLGIDYATSPQNFVFSNSDLSHQKKNDFSFTPTNNNSCTENNEKKIMLLSKQSQNSFLNASQNGQAILFKNPQEIFNSKIFEYQSQNSKQMHYALLMWPSKSLVIPSWAKISNNNDSFNEKFPIIQAVYAGPSVQMVKDSWHNVAHYFKFLSLGFAVLMVDGRGSANRGTEFEGCIKNNLGSVELEDQVEGLNYVAKITNNLLDLSCVGVTGWSYGGYMSLLMLSKYPHIYNAACVGGAVTDWKLYDTAYTERYLGLPQEQKTEYSASCALNYLEKLPNEEGRLLIVHGMFDENVHFQHAEKLLNGLILLGKPHELLLLPRERHSVRKGETIEFFHAKVLIFFIKAFSKNF